jgi:hypothetical protein
MNHKGFTLIETLIYLLLFAILMGGIAAVAYLVLESAGRGQSKVVMQEEGDFLLGKINWGLTGASNATVTPTTLTLSKFGFSNQLIFAASGTKLTLKQGAGLATNLNSDAVNLSGIVFTDIPALNGRPEGVSASATLTTLTPNGVTISQNFQTTKYLRK